MAVTHLDQGVPEWDPSSTGPGQVNAAIRALVERSGMVFATETARDTAIPTGDRVAGMSAYVEATGQVSVVDEDGGSWKVAADLTNPPVGVLAPGTPLVGSLVADAAFRIQAGTVILGTDSNGYAVVTFPSPFPNGVLTFLVFSGESPGGARHIFQGPDISLLPTATATAGYFRVYNDAGAAASGTTVRANWLAIGW